MSLFYCLEVTNEYLNNYTDVIKSLMNDVSTCTLYSRDDWIQRLNRKDIYELNFVSFLHIQDPSIPAVIAMDICSLQIEIRTYIYCTCGWIRNTYPCGVSDIILDYLPQLQTDVTSCRMLSILSHQRNVLHSWFTRLQS